MPRLIAIDMGASAVKATVYHTVGRRSELEGRYVEPVAAGDGSQPDLEARLDALASLVSRHPEWQNPSNRIGVAWSVARATLRRMTLPFADKAQVEKTLPFAVEAEVPFDLDDMVLAWRTLTADGRTEALVALVRERQLRELIQGMAAEQLDPEVVHVDAELLASWARPGRNTAVVDVGHTHTVVAVVSDGVLKSARGITVAGRDFTVAIQRVTGTPFAEAERIKHALSARRGVPGPAEEAATDPGVPKAVLSPQAKAAVDDAMGLLLAEIRSSLIAAEDDLGLEIDEVVLAGGGARMEPFRAYLAQDLGLEVRQPELPDGMPVSDGFAVADAMALRLSGDLPTRAIDLRVGDLEFRGGIDLLRVALSYGTAGLGFFLVASLVVFGLRYRSLAVELTETEAAFKAIVTENFADVSPSAVRDGTTARAIMQEKLDDARERAAVLGDPTGTPPTVDLLYALTKSFPPANQVTVDVSDLTIATGAINFKAETDGYASVAAVEEALQEETRFRDASSKDPKKVRDKVQFQVTIPLASRTTNQEG